MRVLVQRAREGAVTVAGECVGRIDAGLVLLVGIKAGDTTEEAAWMAQKIANLRIFDDDEGHFDRSLLDVGGGALVISQFTLYGDARRGRRPSFSAAAVPEEAAPLVAHLAELLRQAGVAPVAEGRFGANMQVALVNDGPVTIWLDTDVARSGATKA
jgi:D-tyrosyl-tRNA(Tyr) deacylase